MKPMRHKHSVTFRIGAIVQKRLYIYTELGSYQSMDAALAAQQSRPHRAACDVIEQVTDLGYGLNSKLFSAIDGVAL